MAAPHASLFSYNLTRPYPVRWFTPVTIIGGVIVTVLVSLISVGTSGYQLIAIYSADPNVTESSHTWFGKGLGAYLGSMQPKCNAATLPVKSLLYTNNTALPYTIDKVSRVTSDGSVEMLESLVYFNNPLRNCSIKNSDLAFSSMDRGASDIAAYPEGLVTTTYVSCIVDNPQGPLAINLSTTYDKTPFQGRNATSKPSLLWAEAVIWNWWVSLITRFEAVNKALEQPVYKGQLWLGNAQATAPTSADSIKSLNMLSATAYLLPFSTGNADNIYFTTADNITFLMNSSFLDPSFPDVWASADYLAKGLYYTVLADLGQSSPDIPNIFTNPDLLAHFTKNFTEIVAIAQDQIHWAVPYGGLPASPFEASSPEASTLRIDPSVLATQYLCQVPQLKPAGSLIIAILIADIVLLKTIWQVYKLIVDLMLQKRYPDMKFCEGCLARQEQEGLVGEASSLASAVESKGRGARLRGEYQKVHVSERSSVFE